MKQIIKHLKELIESRERGIEMFSEDIRKFETMIEEIRLFKLKNFEGR